MPLCDVVAVNLTSFVSVSSCVAGFQSPVAQQGGAAVEQIRVGTAMSGWYRWAWLRTILGASAFVSIILVVFGDPRAHGFGSAVAIRAIPFMVFAGASLMLLLMGRLSVKYPKQARTIARARSTSMAPHELLDAKRKAGEKYKPEVLVLFSRMLKESSEYITRAIEDVDVEEGCLRLKVVMEFALNDEAVAKVRDAGESIVPLPLIKLAKGATLDNLDMTDCEGRHVSALLQDETYGLLAYVVDDLFRKAYINGASQPAVSGASVPPSRVLSSIEEGVLRSLIQIVNNPEKISDEDLDSAFRLFNAQGPGAPQPVDENAAKQLRGLCEFFAKNYVIVVETELPRGSRLSMKYSRTVPLYEQSAALDTRSRVRLGLSPRSFAVRLTLPFEAPSYHFSLAGVAGSFVGSQQLVEEGMDNKRKLIEPGRFRLGKMQPFMSSKCESALPYTHFHTRGLHLFPAIKMWTLVEFDEVPPGALGGALAVSAASAILVWFFALVQPGLHGAGAIPSDLPALLLTVPAFVATWIGNSVDRVQRSSIATYIGLGVATFVSLASALLYIANTGGKTFFTIHKYAFLGGLVRVNNVDITWYALALIASVMSAYLAETLRERASCYMRLLANDSGFKGPDA